MRSKGTKNKSSRNQEQNLKEINNILKEMKTKPKGGEIKI